jgi:transcriptional regulator with XRE-family HTH domain
MGMATVGQWSGRETRMLRLALRATVRDFAEDLGVSPRTVSKWEAGGAGHTPRPELQAALDTALARASDEQRARFEAASRARDTLPASTSPASRHRPESSPRGPGLAEAAQLRDDMRALAAAYDATPSVSLLAPAARCQAEITDLRTQAPSGPVRRELFTAEAEAATLMGQLVWDASQRRDHATAGTYLQHAVAVAAQIQDPVTEAHAVLRQSFVALYGRRDPAHGLALADRAAHLARHRSLVLAGLALLHVAEAHGMLGDRTACEGALGDAEECFANRGDLDEAAEYYTPTQPGRLAGSCYLSLDLPKQAEALLAATADAMAGEQKVSSLVLGNLALAHIRQRQVDAAVASLHTAIDELERTRGGAGLNVVFTAGRELRPWRHEPAVHEVHDRMLALVATT